MSVMCLNPKTFDKVYYKLEFYENATQVDINYSYSVRDFLHNGGDLKQLIKDWLYLNELSYIRRYREDLEGSKPELSKFLTFKTSELKSIDTYQMLKTLECIQYNIELSTIKTGIVSEQKPMIITAELMDSYEWLTKIIDSCRCAIISSLKKYDSAQWGDF